MELVLGLVALILVLYWLYYALDYDGIHTSERSAPELVEPATTHLLRPGQVVADAPRFALDHGHNRAYPR